MVVAFGGGALISVAGLVTTLGFAVATALSSVA
jgi:hypothetical protein